MNIKIYDKIENYEPCEDVWAISLEKYPELVNFTNQKNFNNEFLKLSDYILEILGKSSEKKIFYMGKDPLFWSSIFIFSLIENNIKLYLKEEEVQIINYVEMKLHSYGFDKKELKKKLDELHYKRLPHFLKSLYYKEERVYVLSKLGEKYVENIGNR